MRQLIGGDTVSRAIIARGTADRDSQRSSCLESLVHRLHCLARPVYFSGAPTDRDDRWVIGGIVCSTGDSIKEAAIGIRCEIDDDMRAWGNRTGNFNIQVDFAIGTVWCSRRMIVSTINRRTCNLRQRAVQLLEVGLPALVLLPPPQSCKGTTF